MLRILWKLLLLVLLVLPSVLLVLENGNSNRLLANAQDPDLADGEDDEGQVETEDADVEPGIPGESVTAQGEADDEDEDDEDKPLKPSPDVDTFILFTQPIGLDLPAGQLVEFLVGMTNKGQKDYIVETLDASFRYPMDFNFYIQNFSTIHYGRLVKPTQQITLVYSFTPNEAFSSRPFGLNVNLMYKDTDGNMFSDAVFNSTVNIIEVDDGLDGETFFLYIFLAAVGVLLVVAGQQFLSSFGRKRPAKKPAVEMGTSNPNDVDFDWLPKETLNELSKSPKRSPRQRRTKRGTGSDE